MGITFNDVHSDTFGIAIITSSIPYIPAKNQTKIQVEGRDGEVVYEGSYKNIIIELSCELAGKTMVEKRKKARGIATWLATTGTLIFDYEKDISYNVIACTNDISASMEGYKDKFTLKFECKPYQEQVYYNDEALWGSPIYWGYAHIPWGGYQRIFDVAVGDTLTIVNGGSYKAKPIIFLEGVADTITFGDFTFENLDGTVCIDSEEGVVYSTDTGVVVNKINDFTELTPGVYPLLNPGDNVFAISGTFTNVNIIFGYKNTYL